MDSKKFIFSPRYTEDSIKLSHVINPPWESFRFSSWRIPDSFSYTVGSTAIYAGSLFVAAINEKLKLPLVDPPYDFLCQLPNYLRLRDVSMVKVRDLWSGYKGYFIKPVDEKTFPAQVYDDSRNIPGLDLLDNEDLVLISDPVEWTSEVRNFVLDGRVFTDSYYRLSNQDVFKVPGSTERTFIEGIMSVLRSTGLDLSALVIDVGHIKGKGWAVIEANPAWASGLYACDPERALEVIKRSCGVNEVL